jgi:hypothetical protein
MPQVLPGGSNTFVPSHEASNKLIVEYARNPKSFVVTEYTQLIKTPKNTGYYLVLNIDEAGRVLNDQGKEYNWADGENAPSGRDGTSEHVFLPFLTNRRAYPFTLGDLAVDQATWDIIAAHAARHAQKAMTVRTMDAVKAATTTGNHIASHIIDVTSYSDDTGSNTGTWAASTSARQDIKRSIHGAIQVMLDDTLAAIDVDDLKLVMSSTLAQAIAQSQELVDYLRGSPDALSQVRGELRSSNPNAEFGLPEKLYGVKLCVEKTRRVTSKRRATRAVSEVLAADTPFLVARPGSLEGHYGAPSFSAITNFIYEEMTTETKHDKDNRRTAGRVVENFVHVVTAKEAMCMFQNAI